MMERRAAESLRNARCEFEAVTGLLLRPTPDVLGDCEERLARAAVEMEAGRPFWSEAVGDREAAFEARSARKALEHTKRLLENAARFYNGWRRLRAAGDGQYGADGSLPELRCAARILARG